LFRRTTIVLRRTLGLGALDKVVSDSFKPPEASGSYITPLAG